MSLGISSSVYPTARRAAILAIGKPVAFEARAEDRDTRGFISMTMILPVAGSTANWMLQPPVSTPTSRMTAMPMSRSLWSSRSVRVRAGATVMESPVCTPTGSTFSMEHTTTTLSAVSRMSSSSYSFQPRIDSSRRTSVVREAARPAPAMRCRSESLKATPLPRPPIVKEGRTTTGYPPRASTPARHSSMVWAMTLRATSAPQRSTTSLNSSRSSPALMAAAEAPMSSTSYSSSTPRSTRLMAALRAVCPPRVGRRASGRSLAMMVVSTSGVIGSM